MWVLAGLMIGCGLACIVWRREATAQAEMFLGGQLHPGCMVSTGVLLILSVVGVCALFRAGVIPLR